MREYPLFIGYAIKCKPFRPLGRVSDFVIERLPDELADIRKGNKHASQLSAHAEKLIASLADMSFPASAPIQDQVLLDLLLIESGIVHSGGMAGRRLVGLINKFAKKADRIPGLTYEDLIFVNLRNRDVRTFTNGDIALSERDFYEGHKRIEALLEKCIVLCRKVISDPTAVQNPKRILAVTACVEKIERYTKELRVAMPKEHFSILRQYFLSHPYRGFKGPSGAFSARFPILEVLLAGERLPAEMLQYYMEDNHAYLPRADRLLLKDAFRGIDEKKTITQMLLVHPHRKLYEAVEACSNAIRRFRAEHYKAVRHHLPEALRGNTIGTAGEQDVGKFLRGRMRTRHIEKKRDMPN